jgi:hypothetical protein
MLTPGPGSQRLQMHKHRRREACPGGPTRQSDTGVASAAEDWVVGPTRQPNARGDSNGLARPK